MYTPWKLVFLFIGHFIVDEFKCIGVKFNGACADSKKAEQDNLGLLYMDQAWHVVQCIIVCLK
jgi:hypothetical protein